MKQIIDKQTANNQTFNKQTADKQTSNQLKIKDRSKTNIQSNIKNQTEPRSQQKNQPANQQTNQQKKQPKQKNRLANKKKTKKNPKPETQPTIHHPQRLTSPLSRNTNHTTHTNLINHITHINQIKKINEIHQVNKCNNCNALNTLTQQLQSLNKKLTEKQHELAAKQQALSENLQAALNIQLNLLPPINPPQPFPPQVNIGWFCQPSELVGGDICWVAPEGNGRYIIAYLLDVSGHGVPSAMMTVSMTQFLRQMQFIPPFSSPKEILVHLNKEYPFEKFEMFATLFYLILDIENGQFVYCNGGHPPGICLKENGERALLDPTGPMIGISHHSSFEQREGVLTPGDKFFLYSDGIIEYRNHEGEFFGSERLFSLIKQHQSRPINEIIALIKENLSEFGNGEIQKDDISMIGIEFSPNLFSKKTV